MHDQRGHVELLEILVEVGFGKGLDAIVEILDTTLHAPQPELVDQSMRNFRPLSIEAKERDGEFFPELRTVFEKTAAQSVEHFDRDSFRVGGGFYHDWWHSADQDGPGNTLCAVPADVACHFAAARGVTKQRGILQIKRFDERCQIVGVAVHVVAEPCLAGAAMTTPIMRDHPKTVLGQKMHLAVPCIGTERPSVGKRYDRALAPVFVVDCRAILRRNGAHTKSSP